VAPPTGATVGVVLGTCQPVASQRIQAYSWPGPGGPTVGPYLGPLGGIPCKVLARRASQGVRM